MAIPPVLSIDGAPTVMSFVSGSLIGEINMKAAALVLALGAVALAGCSGASGLSTASLFGTDEKPKATGPVNDPTTRAFQVGTVSARGVKCGFNFDPAKLKATYLMYESKQPGGTENLAKVEKIYDVSFNGVAKAVAEQADYCTDAKTTIVKADLNRHLKGDYTPHSRPKPVEEGLFSGWGDGGKSKYSDRPMQNSLP